MIILYILGIILFVMIFLPIIFPTKCPKCNNDCKDSYYFPGIVDSLYKECPNCGDINKFHKN